MTVTVHHRPEHVVPPDELVPGPFQVRRRSRVVGDVEVAGAGHAAIVEDLVPAELVGSLHLGQRERLVPAVRVRDQFGGVGVEVGQQVRLVLDQPRLTLVSEDAARRPESELTVVGPQPDSELLELGHQVTDVHRIPSSEVSAALSWSSMLRARSATVGAAKKARSDTSTP